MTQLVLICANLCLRARSSGATQAQITAALYNLSCPRHKRSQLLFLFLRQPPKRRVLMTLLSH